MRAYTKITPRLWRDPKLLEHTDEVRLLYLYLFAGPHQTSCGVSRVPREYIAADLRWEPVHVTVALKELVEDVLVLVDKDTDEIAIVDWFASNGPMNEKHYLGIEQQLRSVESEALRNEMGESLRQAWAKSKPQPVANTPSPLLRTGHLSGVR